MPSLTHFNPSAGSVPYKGLFSNVTLVPANTSLAYISTQWACDPKTGELIEGVEGDYVKQSKIVWENVVLILKELGAQFTDIVHKTVSFKEFDDEKGKDAMIGLMDALPDEWKGDATKSSLTYNGVGNFHRPGIVYTLDLVVAVPSK